MSLKRALEVTRAFNHFPISSILLWSFQQKIVTKTNYYIRMQTQYVTLSDMCTYWSYMYDARNPDYINSPNVKTIHPSPRCKHCQRHNSHPPANCQNAVDKVLLNYSLPFPQHQQQYQQLLSRQFY